MDKMFGKKISFGGLKETMQNAQQEISSGWKNIAEKAKKEAKIANKKARKFMEVEDGGHLRHGYILSVNLNAGYDVFKRFQENWVTMHEESMTNIKKCDHVDNMINSFAKDYYASRDLLNEFHGNLLALSEVLSRVEIAQSRIDSIGKSMKQIENLLLEYEDACERLELEKQKEELKEKLSQLVGTKHAEYTLKKQIVEGSKKPGSLPEKVDETTRVVAANTTPSTTTVDKKSLEQQNSMEKQKAYQDAFLQQMNEYIRSGEVEKPIAGSAGLTATDETADIDIEIGESDFSALSEFLGPEEMNSVLQASASQQSIKLARMSNSSATWSTDNILSKVVDTQQTEETFNLVEKTAPDSDAEKTVDPTNKNANDLETTEVVESSTNENNDVIEVTADVEPSPEEDTGIKSMSPVNSDEEFFDADK